MKDSIQEAGKQETDDIEEMHILRMLRERYSTETVDMIRRSWKRCQQAAPSVPSSGKMQDMEQEILKQLMSQYKGNISKVAKDMGVARTTVYRKLKKYDLIRTLS